ncbi:MAG: hypothetical protein JRJ38_14240 [Deltaproteobacteria bacterium]|nr:hypothetical protein [Deltaproteobacteria bacterium]
MECPFKEIEPFDFDSFSEEAEIRIEQIGSILKIMREAYRDDIKLFPALNGVLTLLDSFCLFVSQTGGQYESFEEEYDKKRALAEACRQAKAPSEDPGSTRP